MRAIAQIKDAATVHAKLKPIHDTFLKKNFKLTKDAYAAQHKEELDAFNKAVRTLMKLNGGTTVDFSALDMLNQANGDRQILAKQLNISPHQLSYVTHSGEGEGLLFFGNVICRSSITSRKTLNSTASLRPAFPKLRRRKSMSKKQPKLKFEEEKERTATRSPPKKSKVEQSVPQKQKLKQDADKAAEKAQHLRFGKAEITPDEASRMTKQQKRAMYAAAAARSAVHREIDQYEDDNVGMQALSEGEKAAETAHDISKSRYARKLKKKAKMQGKKGAKTAKSSPQKPTAAQDAGASCTGEGGSNWLSRWRQKQDIRQSYYAAAHSGTAAQTAGGKAVSNGTTAAKSGMEQVIDKGRSVVSTAVNGIANFAKSNAHVLLIVGVFLLLLMLVMSAFSSCSILFSGTTQVSGQTIYTAEDRDIRGAETDYKKLEKELDKKIKRTPTDHPGYDEYRYHLDAIEHDPWQLTSFLTTLYDDYTRSEVQAKLKETFAKQYKLTTWVEVQTRYRTVVMIDIFTGIPYTVQVPYEYRIFHTKLVNKGLEVVIREELNNDQWKRYEIFQDTLGGRPYLFNGGLPPGGSDGSGAPGIDYQVPAEALTDEEFAAIYKEAQKYVGTPYVWGGSTRKLALTVQATFVGSTTRTATM